MQLSSLCITSGTNGGPAPDAAPDAALPPFAAPAAPFLIFSPQKSSGILKKLLDSAVANAENNLGADIDELRVVSIEVNEAPRFKRFRARAKGRGERRIKRNSHITIRVGDDK